MRLTRFFEISAFFHFCLIWGARIAHFVTGIMANPRHSRGGAGAAGRRNNGGRFNYSGISKKYDLNQKKAEQLKHLMEIMMVDEKVPFP